MKAIVSFCNEVGDASKSNLLLLNIESGEMKWVPFDLENVGFRGISQDENYIYALYHAKKPGIFVLDKKTLMPFIRQEISEAKDAHSMIVDENNIYIVSTGTDQVLKYQFDKKNKKIYFSEVFWSPKGSLQNSDTHHLNSIFKKDQDIYISAFGPRKNNLWSSATAGYVLNLTRNQKVIENVTHPHSVFVRGEDIFYCESSTKTVKMNGKTIIRLDSGYTRGLFLKDDCLVLGTNSGRKVQNSDGFVANPADPGQLMLDCRVLIYKKKNISDDYALSKSFDFLPNHKEIYDVIILS